MPVKKVPVYRRKVFIVAEVYIRKDKLQTEASREAVRKELAYCLGDGDEISSGDDIEVLGMPTVYLSRSEFYKSNTLEVLAAAGKKKKTK